MQNRRLHLEMNGQRDALRDAIEKDGPTIAALLAHSECLSHELDGGTMLLCPDAAQTLLFRTYTYSPEPEKPKTRSNFDLLLLALRMIPLAVL